MDIAAEIKAALAEEWLPTIYREKIRSQRTRSISINIPERENQAEIQYTLLGIELKVGKQRIASPDLATARYMRVFARIGCREFAIPYDITTISTAADEIETAWQKTILLIGESSRARTPRSQSQLKSKVIRDIRTELNEIGPGNVMPEFNRQTSQRLG